jgi:hypothetical protein
LTAFTSLLSYLHEPLLQEIHHFANMEPSKVFADRITSLLQGGEQWSDLTIENQDESTFNVHRVIFCSQSKVIDRIVRNQNPNVCTFWLYIYILLS